MKKRAEAGQQVLELLKSYRWHIAISIILALLPSYFSVWTPYAIGRLVDEGILARDADAVLRFTFLLLFLKLALFVVRAGASYCLSIFGLQILVDYRQQLLHKILSYPISFFDRMSSGQLTTRLTNDINSLQEFFSSALVPLVGNTFLVLGVMIGMFLVHWQLALVTVLILPMIVWLTLGFHERIRRRFGFMRKTLSSLNSFAGESFGGSRELQVFSALDQNQQEFDRLSKKWQIRFNQAVREYALYNPVAPFLTMMMTAMVLCFGSWLISRGRLSVGELIAFLAYAANFEAPIREFAEKFTVFQQALASVDRLMEVSNHRSEKDEGNSNLASLNEIRFQNISFSYSAEAAEALSQISFTVKAGQKVALLGETGSGKTTTCSLLMRFYELQKGEIFINDQDIRSYKLDSLRNQVGWVSQDVVLFSESLRENIRFYDEKVSDERIWEILEWVQLKTWVESLPEGLNQILTERGSSISAGQRQLLSLARALARQPQILIFDEATSYIDSQTEYLLQQAMEKLWTTENFKKVTAFFIAHRLSTLKRCDQMLVFKKGQLIEQGSLSELLAQKGYAAQLFEQHFFGAQKKAG